MMRKLQFFVVAMVLALTLNAGTRDDFKANYKQVANNYYAYPDRSLPALSRAPEGYKAFYINHYGRHGSRWLLSENNYHLAVATLGKADSAGVLTAQGKAALAIFKDVEAASQKRLGELSDIGAEQHQRIATRMIENYPDVFAGDARVDARSTVVIRCILSMQNAVTTLKALNPRLRITTDASAHDMYYMNNDDQEANKIFKAEFSKVKQQLQDQYLHPERLLRTLFTDYEWAQQNIANPQELMTNLLDLVGNMQSHHQFENVDLYHLFTEEERYNIWAYNNLTWYLWGGFAPLTHKRMPYRHAPLLRNFIATADQAIAEGRNCATLRFGHESVVLPLVCLMGLNGMNLSTDNLDSVAEKWQSYKVFPMGANVQWIFYHAEGKPVLVKFLLNEHEASLPDAVKPVSGPYYRWTDAKAYFEQVLAAQPADGK